MEPELLPLLTHGGTFGAALMGALLYRQFVERRNGHGSAARANLLKVIHDKMEELGQDIKAARDEIHAHAIELARIDERLAGLERLSGLDRPTAIQHPRRKLPAALS